MTGKERCWILPSLASLTQEDTSTWWTVLYCSLTFFSFFLFFFFFSIREIFVRGSICVYLGSKLLLLVELELTRIATILYATFEDATYFS